MLDLCHHRKMAICPHSIGSLSHTCVCLLWLQCLCQHHQERVYNNALLPSWCSIEIVFRWGTNFTMKSAVMSSHLWNRQIIPHIALHRSSWSYRWERPVEDSRVVLVGEESLEHKFKTQETQVGEVLFTIIPNSPFIVPLLRIPIIWSSVSLKVFSREE